MDTQKNEKVLNAKTHSLKKIPWLGLGFSFSTIAVIVLFGLFYYAAVRGSELSGQLSKEVASLQVRLNDTEAHVDSLKRESAESTDSFKQSIAALQQTLGNNPNTWRVMEAQFDVSLADTQLRFENNVLASIQLLQLADLTLRDLSDPALDTIRHALAQNITALQAVPVVDTTGIYMRLSALNEQIDQLPLLMKSSEELTAQQSSDVNEPWWKKGLHESLQLLQKVVVVRYNTSNVPPLVTPTQRDFLFENIHAMLEKSMWALLHHQPEIYQASLSQSIKWINQFFASDSSSTQSVVTNLTDLQKINISPTLPNVNASIQAFQDYFGKTTKSG